MQWCGDVDLYNRKLKKLYKVYRQWLDFVQKVNVGISGEKGVIDELTIISKELVEDLDFLHTRKKQTFILLS